MAVRGTLTASMQTALAAAGGRIAHLYVFSFSGGDEHFTDNDTDITWSGNTYTATGGHIGHEIVQETGELGSMGVNMTLDGVESTALTHITGENYIGRAAKIYLAYFDSSFAVVSDPELIFDGLMNEPWQVRVQGNTAKITTRLQPKVAVWRQRRGIKCDLHSHQLYYSSDTFFRHMAEAKQQGVLWGKQESPKPPQRPPDTGGRDNRTRTRETHSR